MKKIKNLIQNIPDKSAKIITGAFISLLGLYLLVFPGTSIKNLCCCLGAVTAGMGLVRTVKYLKATKTKSGKIFDIISAILLFGCSAVLFRPSFAASVLPFILGIIIFLSGISNFFNIEKGLVSKSFSILTMALGLFLIFNPFSGAKAITSVIGLGILIFGVLFTVKEIASSRSENVIIDENGYKEIEFRDIEE